MPSRLLLSIIGEAGSGKSETCRYLAEQWGFWTVYPGQIIRDLAGRPITRREAPGILDGLRRNLGADFLLRPIVDSSYERIVFDGNRAPYERDGLRALGAITILLHCDELERLRRENLKRDQRGENPFTLDAFRDSQANDYNKDDPFQPSIEKVMSNPDYTIDTTGLNKQQVHSAIDSIVLQELGETPSQQR